MVLLFAMIKSVVKLFKVPVFSVVAARLLRITDLTPKTLGYLTLVLDGICQMNDLLLGGFTTCMRESLEPERDNRYMYMAHVCFMSVVVTVWGSMVMFVV